MRGIHPEPGIGLIPTRQKRKPHAQHWEECSNALTAVVENKRPENENGSGLPLHILKARPGRNKRGPNNRIREQSLQRLASNEK